MQLYQNQYIGNINHQYIKQIYIEEEKKTSRIFKGLNLEERNKVQLLYKNILSRQLSKKLNYIKLGLFIIKKKIIKVNYKLDLLVKIRIYSVQYIAILELVYREYKLLVYKADMYKGREEDKQKV